MKLINRLFIAEVNAGGGQNDDKNKSWTLEELKKREAEERKKKDEGKEHKHSTFHQMLQDWANDNARDIEEDDSDPLRSGL